MPALPVIANAFLIAQGLTDAGENHEFRTLHCVTVATPLPAVSVVAASFALAYKNNLLPVLSSDITLADTEITPLDGTSITQIITTASAGSIGGHTTGNAMPNALALVITWRTLHRGKSFRGRTFLPGVKSDQVVGTESRTLTTGTVAALNTAGAGFISGLSASTPNALALNVLSRKLGSATVVTTATANLGTCLQRRRYEHVAHD